jgi:UDP-N-acetyl-D-glucosamine dehydrogenase
MLEGQPRPGDAGDGYPWPMVEAANTAGGSPLESLAERIRSREAVVAVVGLGYVGLPLLVAVGGAGFEVLGYDTDRDKIASLRAGRSYIVDVSDSEIASMRGARFASDAAELRRADVVAICVPTPLTDHAPDLTMVRDAAAAVSEQLLPGRLVILESTTYPGTTEEEVGPILEKSGLAIGADLALAYSPERIDPGQREHRLDNTPKIVAGVTDRCRELAASFYGHICRELVQTSSPREAEMAKLVENTFRQVNIALVNELAILARELGVDIWEALAAAATKPFGYMPFWPGPGVGGHCISIDPSYLSWRAGQRLGYRAGFIEHANEVNNRMPDYVVARVGEALNDAGKPIRGSKVLAVGVAYKGGVDDRRESPALTVMARLQDRGANVGFSDPFVEAVRLGDRTIASLPLDAPTLRNQDCVLILTAHPGMDVRGLVAESPLVFDTRGVTTGVDDPRVRRL